MTNSKEIQDVCQLSHKGHQRSSTNGTNIGPMSHLWLHISMTNVYITKALQSKHVIKGEITGYSKQSVTPIISDYSLTLSTLS